jgi:alpha-beta hydrolase superfamily lysophospholipase
LTDIELVIYDGGRHEVFNEINKTEVLADLVEWIDARI